ncbi:MAG: trehalose-phosphatase [Deltaproteobacteria bacterium]|nr:trehalose-phosphatase [Deltaproteobacteria bacterium]
MPYLFTESGLTDLRRFVDHQTLFAFDLDGTLAPITSDRHGTRVSEATTKELAHLVDRAAVAIITGRSRSDAQARLGIVPRFLVGNHGAEGLPGWETREKKFAGICLAWEKQLRSFLPPADASGISIENKGSTLSVHYRAALDREKAHSLVLRGIDLLIPHPRRIEGKCVENLLPEMAPDKGTAMRCLMGLSGCPKGLYTGDDVTDEDVFRLDSKHLLTIRVGTGGLSLARYQLRNQQEIVRLLKEINHRLSQ